MLVGAMCIWQAAGCAALSTVPPAMPPGAAAPAAPAAVPPPTTAQAGSTTVVAVAPPAQPCCKQTLPEWLGLTNCCAKIQRILSVIPGLVGLFAPGMGQAMSDAANQPPLLPVNSPANLQSSNPAVQTAAQVMNDENQAPQKIAAINYLATIGCAGCYPDVEAALLASLDDCTESVRFAAAKALHDTSGRPCRHCNSKACCSAKVRQKLSDVAYDMKADDCFKESSARVRRMARLALLNCGSDCFVDDSLLAPQEGPALLPQPAGPGAPGGAGGAAPGGAAPGGAAPAAVPPSPQASSTVQPRPVMSSAVSTLGTPVRQWSARGDVPADHHAGGSSGARSSGVVLSSARSQPTTSPWQPVSATREE